MRGMAWSKSGFVWMLAVGCWLMVLAGGFAALHRYEARPGSAGEPAKTWPAKVAIPLEPQGLTLVLALHPRCPCSAATCQELERILTAKPNGARLHVLLFKPADVSDDWTATSTTRSLEALPNVRCWIDENCKLADIFGAATSGELLVYDARGKLRFAGGVTPLRGQAGSNPGSDALMALLDGKPIELRTAPVFGCSIRSTSVQDRGEN